MDIHLSCPSYMGEKMMEHALFLCSRARRVWRLAIWISMTIREEQPTQDFLDALHQSMGIEATRSVDISATCIIYHI